MLRAKGFVRFADHPPALLSQAEESVVLEALEEAPEEPPLHLNLGEEEEGTEIVFIGQGILRHWAKLERALALGLE